ncbi:hypothetical protein AB4Y45_41020 [Paraburkholderia sp. EG287A]|uniref:hypothetical protein n=1 Tax=unclassified Paraburkholderia TaxID=2615204 RepID=UPI0034D2F7F4
MNINSARILDLIDERYTCGFNGKTFTVVIRRGVGVTALSDFDNFSPGVDVHVVVLGGTASVADQLRQTFSDAKNGDSILVYCQVGERHEAALRTLCVRRPSLTASA